MGRLTAVSFELSFEGALLIAATLLLVVATLRLAEEAQLARLTASVVLQPMLWPRNETVMATDMFNVGSATAREIRLSFQWFGPDGAAVGDAKAYPGEA